MPINDFIGFATGGSANVATQADYAAAPEITGGMSASSMASSKMCNKVWRQGANMAAALGRIAAARGYDALDNGDLNALQNTIDDTISVGTFNRMFFSQTSGNYTAPRTGVYRITLKGGGGGGAGADGKVPGCSGAEGGMVIFYATLTKSTSYAYTIGAGGSAGALATSGGAGGNTTMTIGGTTYTANGGGGGGTSAVFSTAEGGTGSPSSAYIIKGAPGQAAINNMSAVSTNYVLGPTGGGNGGGKTGGGAGAGVYGGGGAGGPYYSGSSQTGGAGGDGYILIEYAG